MADFKLDYKDLIKEAKSKIEEGFSKMNNRIDNPAPIERYLVVATLRADRLSDSIVTLCENGFGNEALIILRTLIEHSFNMRWIMEDDIESRLKKYLSDLENVSKNISFGGGWSGKSLDKRMKEIGFVGREYYDYVVKLTYAYAHANASSLDWEKVIKDKRINLPQSSQPIYAVASQMLGHVLKSLELCFGEFSGCAEDIWGKINVDKSSIKEKLEEIKTQFKERRKINE